MPYHEMHPLQLKVLETAAERIKSKIYTPKAKFDIVAYVSAQPLPFKRRHEGEKKTLKVGDVWGKVWDCAWFECSVCIPSDAVAETLVARLDFSGEALLVDKDGAALKGFTSVKSRMTYTLGNVGKTVWPVSAAPGERVTLTLDAGNNDLFGNYKGGTVEEAELCSVDTEMRALYYDYSVLYELLRTLDKNCAWFARLLHILSTAERLFDGANAAECRHVLAPALAVNASPDGFDLSVLGHAHLDLAWTWPLRETHRKAARTFATAVAHLNRDPDYLFGASQVQLYDWIKSEQPALFASIQKLAAAGRWEIQGGMWTESDLNIAGGESLVRQFVCGQDFYRKNFGKSATVCWLPDCFGFSGALPQLIRGAGMTRLVTQKIKTSPVRVKYPHDTFFWEGIDGSRVLTAVAPYENYGSGGTPTEVKACEERFLDKAVCPSALFLVGQGDGGGGAGAEVLECVRRERSLKGLAPLEWRTAENFFERIEKSQSDYASWYGSMDLDMHTGSLTTHANSKRLNKLIETKLHTLEWLMTQTKTPVLEKAQLDDIWKRVLLYQFHDILPGTCIQSVYDETEKNYAEMLETLGAAIERAARQIAADYPKEKTVVFNASPFARTEMFAFEGKTYRAELAPYGIAAAEKADNDAHGVRLTEDGFSNDFIRVKFAPDGRVTSVYDLKSKREFLKESGGNALSLYEDCLNYGADEWSGESAWDIPIRYADKIPKRFQADCVTYCIADGRAVCEIKGQIGNSPLCQKISLSPFSRRIDFETTVDWREEGQMLRVGFDVDIFTKKATRGLQFGCATQNAHKNTEWDYSMFETVGQRFVDMSDAYRGAALLCPDRYGYRVQDARLDLCLLRSTSYPAIYPDKGVHTVTYALVVHDGDYAQSDVLAQAYALEQLLVATSGGGAAAAEDKTPNFAPVEGSVILETVKVSEDGEGIVCRYYEPYGGETAAVIPCPKNYSAQETNLLEDVLQTLKPDRETLRIAFCPHQIKTLLFKKRKK